MQLCLTFRSKVHMFWVVLFAAVFQIKRTEGVSTTDIVGRMLTCTRVNHDIADAVVSNSMYDSRSHTSLMLQSSCLSWYGHIRVARVAYLGLKQGPGEYTHTCWLGFSVGSSQLWQWP
jgi:hypothetical protein